jgi:MerR family transcriptional regulator/heat shock protein HspR
LEATYCLVVSDKSEICNSCEMVRNCIRCHGCKE